MIEPDAILDLLVIDDDVDIYQTFFDFTGWVKHGRSQPNAPFTPEIVLSLLNKTYDAILLDFIWFERYEANIEALILSEIMRANTPIIIVTEGNTPGKYAKAMSIGASGFLPKEEFLREIAQEEILSITQLYASPTVEKVTKPSLEKPAWQVIAYLLQQPSICFRHWTDYFAKPPEEVFDEEVLEVLNDWVLHEIEDVLRFAIFTAHSEKAAKININHLPGRVRKRKLDEVMDELDCIEKQLSDGRSWEEVVQSIKNADLKATIRQHRADFPYLVTKRRFPAIFNCFELNLLVLYAYAKRETAKVFVEKYLSLLKHEINISVSDYGRLPRVEISEVLDNRYHLIHETADTVDAFVFLLCTDFLQPESIGTKIATKAANRQADGRPLVIYILMEHCNWEFVIEKDDPKILPGIDRPLSKEADMNAIFTEMNKAIKEELFSIWGY